jgi:hypothetical protein
MSLCWFHMYNVVSERGQGVGLVDCCIVHTYIADWVVLHELLILSTTSGSLLLGVFPSTIRARDVFALFQWMRTAHVACTTFNTTNTPRS